MHNCIENSAAIFGIVMCKEFPTALVIFFRLREILRNVFNKIFYECGMVGNDFTERMFFKVINFVFRLYGEIFRHIVNNGFVEISHFIEKFGIICDDNSGFSRKESDIFFGIGIESDVFIGEK